MKPLQNNEKKEFIFNGPEGRNEMKCKYESTYIVRIQEIAIYFSGFGHPDESGN